MALDKRRIVFVGGIPSLMAEEAIRSHFEQFGALVKVRVMRDKKSKEAKGYAFVTAAEPETAAKILAHPTHVIDGRRLDCQLASRKGEKRDWKEDQKKRRIFVSGLPQTLTSQALQLRFEQFGPLRNAYVIFDFESGLSKGYGYVEFQDAAVASCALEADVAIDGVKIACLPYLGRHEQKSQAWPRPDQGSAGSSSDEAFVYAKKPTARSHAADALHVVEDGSDSEARLHSTASNKHNKYEYLASSSRLNEAASNYRFNRAPLRGSLQNYVDRSMNNQSTCCGTLALRGRARTDPPAP